MTRRPVSKYTKVMRIVSGPIAATMAAFTVATVGCANPRSFRPTYPPESRSLALVGIAATSIGADVLDRHGSSTLGRSWAAAGTASLGVALADAIVIENARREAATLRDLSDWYTLELYHRNMDPGDPDLSFLHFPRPPRAPRGTGLLAPGDNPPRP